MDLNEFAENISTYQKTLNDNALLNNATYFECFKETYNSYYMYMLNLVLINYSNITFYFSVFHFVLYYSILILLFYSLVNYIVYILPRNNKMTEKILTYSEILSSIINKEKDNLKEPNNDYLYSNEVDNYTKCKSTEKLDTLDNVSENNDDIFSDNEDDCKYVNEDSNITKGLKKIKQWFPNLYPYSKYTNKTETLNDNSNTSNTSNTKDKDNTFTSISETYNDDTKESINSKHDNHVNNTKTPTLQDALNLPNIPNNLTNSKEDELNSYYDELYNGIPDEDLDIDLHIDEFDTELQDLNFGQ